MRFTWDPEKSKRLRANPARGIGFEEAREIFNQRHPEDYRCDDPEQHRAIGWVNGILYSIIYEPREDEEGEYPHLVTLWKSTKEERKQYEEFA